MIEDIYSRLKNLLKNAKCTVAPSTETAAVQLQDQVLTDVPVLHLAGLKIKPQINQDMLLLIPAGELDHAVALNSVGIRKTALFLGVSHKSVINWINKAQISKEVQRANSPDEKVADSIEIDEIYTFVKKNSKEP